MKSIIQLTILFVFTIFVTSRGRIAHAHGDPIIVTAQDGALSTNGNVFLSEFEPLGPLTFTDIPGFEFHGFNPAEPVSFEIVDHLWYWNALDQVTPAQEDLEFRIEGKSAPFPSVSVKHNATHVAGINEFVPGFTFETIDGLSSQHQHLLAYLFESESVPAGGYGVVLRVTSPSYESTPPFLLAFNQNLSAALFQNAVADLTASAFADPYPRGDFNHDGLVDAIDVDLLFANRDGSEVDLFDLNGDAVVDNLDVDIWVREIVATEFGDANLDGRIDLSDLNQVRNQFGAAGGWAAGDSDGSGLVDLADLNHVRNHFGLSGTPVPEPATGWLGITLIAGLAGLRRRRFRH